MEYFKLNKNETFLISQKAIIIEDDKLLILKNNEKNTTWELPGGLLEFDEDLKEGLERELLEETGNKIKIGKLLFIADAWASNFVLKDSRTLDVRTVALGYICEKEKGKIKLSEENEDFMWATKNDISKLNFGPKTTPLIKQIIEMNLVK